MCYMDISYIYMRAQAGVHVNRRQYAEPMGLYKAISKGCGESRASCQRASIAEQVCCLGSLFTLLGPIRKVGDRKCG